MIALESGKTYVWQWDKKRRVVLTGVDASTEVHFSNSNSKTAPVVLTYADGDKIVADVPVLLMQEPLDITVYVGDQYNTEHCSYITVLAQPKPSDYVYEEVEIVRYAELAERITKLERPGEEYAGQLLYVTAAGYLTPLKLGPGLSIRGGVLYVSGGVAPDEPDTPVGEITCGLDSDNSWRVYLDGVEILPVVEDGSGYYPGLEIYRAEDGSGQLRVKEA